MGNVHFKPIGPANQYVELGDITVVFCTGGHFFIDTEDAPRVKALRWHIPARNKAYPLGHILRGVCHVPVGRLILSFPKGKFIDHIDGNKLNNTKENLRECSITENNRNKKQQKNSRLKYKGVAVGSKRIDGSVSL
jgi:hypothetical protein